MRPLVIVKPDKAFDGTAPMPEGPPALQGVRQPAELLEKRRGSGAHLFGRDGHDGLTARIVHRREFVVMSDVSESRQHFGVDMQQLPGPALLVAFRRPASGSWALALARDASAGMHGSSHSTIGPARAGRPETNESQDYGPRLVA
jgi:hypothetical protein